MFNFKMQVNVTECNSRNYSIEWQIQKSTNVSHTFLRYFLPFKRCKNFKFLSFKKQIKFIECNFYNYTIRWQSQNLKMSPGHFCNSSYLFRDIINFNFFTFKKQVKFTDYNFCNYPIRQQMSNQQMSSTRFALALTALEIKVINLFTLKKVDQGHRVHFSQLYHSMGNLKIYLCLTDIFTIVSYT